MSWTLDRPSGYPGPYFLGRVVPVKRKISWTQPSSRDALRDEKMSISKPPGFARRVVLRLSPQVPICRGFGHQNGGASKSPDASGMPKKTHFLLSDPTMWGLELLSSKWPRFNKVRGHWAPGGCPCGRLIDGNGGLSAARVHLTSEPGNDARKPGGGEVISNSDTLSPWPGVFCFPPSGRCDNGHARTQRCLRVPLRRRTKLCFVGDALLTRHVRACLSILCPRDPGKVAWLSISLLR